MENRLLNMKLHHFGLFMLPEQMVTSTKCTPTSSAWPTISTLETLAMRNWWNALDQNLVRRLSKDNNIWKCVTIESELIYSKIISLTFNLEKSIISNTGKFALQEDSPFHLVIKKEAQIHGDLTYYKTIFWEVIHSALIVH